MVKTESIVAELKHCQYQCTGNQWVLISGNPPAGFMCLATQSGACTAGATKWTAAVPIPNESPALAANFAEYVYLKSTKSLHFKAGKCGKGKHFPAEISMKQLATIDPDAAELVKSIQKYKRIASFSVVLKAQKIEKA